MATKKTDSLFVAIAPDFNGDWMAGWGGNKRDAVDDLLENNSVAGGIKVFEFVCPLITTAAGAVTKIVVK